MAVALPMESNPETMNRYLQKLGVPSKWRMVDVVGLEEDALSWVPRPVLAVILLFPLSPNYEQHRAQQESELLKKGNEAPKDVFYLKQVLSNVCGAIALVHSVANNTNKIDLEDGLLKNYINDAKSLDAAGKGALLENSANILQAYKEAAESADKTIEEENEPVNYHFVTFIHRDGNLYELDGRKSSPINHGPTTAERLLEDAAKICRDFIAREPDNIGFNVVALVPIQ
ncbi:ubiquitin carboxyl-terminal hydrolase-like [Pararge aegeria]|uniref:Ubiquitin carboxyl-terminal hydrolase n=1 Tax=Pararge aegeria aegeria TaxID=348720 RepID=A0A8S4RWB4_9NEOP|nr:ubiquitin carboxyl-terminal hydrolase-like [Pararge aegeria]CAH2241511.1 jg10678 [Pararge aegeria aegeria]